MKKEKSTEEYIEEQNDSKGEEHTADDQIRESLAIIQMQVTRIQKLLLGNAIEIPSETIVAAQQKLEDFNQSQSAGTQIIEGVFDGTMMIGPDGKKYQVPANYASKSKLVEGDILKLTITPQGGFAYKQIGPIERDRFVGNLMHDESTNEFKVVANGKPYRVLTASITYYKAEIGDEVIILVPKNSDSKWAAVENIIKKI